MTKKIIAFGASSSKSSINKQLATFAANQFQNVSVEILDLNDYEMPIFSVDKEKEFSKESLEKFLREKSFKEIEINKIEATIEDSFILLLSV